MRSALLSVNSSILAAIFEPLDEYLEVMLEEYRAQPQLLARLRIYLTRLERNPPRYFRVPPALEALNLNAIFDRSYGPRAMACLLRYQGVQAQRILDDPRYQVDPSIDSGIITKSERQRLVSPHGLLR